VKFSTSTPQRSAASRSHSSRLSWRVMCRSAAPPQNHAIRRPVGAIARRTVGEEGDRQTAGHTAGLDDQRLQRIAATADLHDQGRLFDHRRRGRARHAGEGQLPLVESTDSCRRERPAPPSRWRKNTSPFVVTARHRDEHAWARRSRRECSSTYGRRRELIRQAASAVRRQTSA